jgi:hypothetical protein
MIGARQFRDDRALKMKILVTKEEKGFFRDVVGLESWEFTD